MKVFGYRSFTVVFLGALALSPVTALFWQIHWRWAYANWLAYPLVLIFLLGALLVKRKFPAGLRAGLAVSVFYSVIFFWWGGDWESLVRLMVALMPLFFVAEIRDSISTSYFNLFWRIYLVALCIPLAVCVLQLLGYVPYYDSGMAYNLYPGRISGGYLKPNNLNAIMFPAYLFGFYLFYRGDKWKGAGLIGIVLLVVLVGGLRTSVVTYGFVLAAAGAPRFINSALHRGFRYYVFIGAGIGIFFFLGQGREIVGIQEGLRLRLPMWMIHSEYFFHSNSWQILFGKGLVQLPEETKKYGIASLTEPHNNGIRLMITFGVIGYCLYGLLLRDVAIRVYSSVFSDRLKFLHFACLIHVLLYSITNEPAFYPGVFWPLTGWIFFTTEPANNSFKE